MSLLVDFLNRAPAKVIAVDFGFSERDRVLQYQIGTEKWSGAESDDALVKSVKEARNTILLADAIYEGLASGEQSNKPPNGGRNRTGSIGGSSSAARSSRRFVS